MKTKALLVVTAVVEGTVGVILLVAPSSVVAVLLGARLESAEAEVVARIAGAALFSIGLTCWLVRNSPEGGAHTARIAGLLAYNAAVAALLVFAAVGQHLHGIALWPAVAAHLALSIWCGVVLPRGRRSRPGLATGARSSAP
jgi:urea transporter